MDKLLITGTRDAFAILCSVKGVHKRLGVSASTVSGWKRYLRTGEKISLDKMEEMLLKSGCLVEKNKIWDVPSIKGRKNV